MARGGRNLIWRWAAAGIGAAGLWGCETPPSCGHLAVIQELQDQKAAQARELASKDEQLQSQQAVVAELRALGPERTLDRLAHVDRIEIETLSGGFDDDHNGIDEGVVVYLSLIDQDGDTIKASGPCSVELFDLAKPAGAQSVGRIELSADQMRPLWFGRFMTKHFTVKVPWSGGAPRAEHAAITARVLFTDLLTGKVHEAQAVLEVRGAALPVG